MRQSFVLLVCSWLTLVTANAGSPPAGTFSLSICIPKTTIYVGEAVPLEIKITNISVGDIGFALPLGERLYFAVTLLDSRKKPVPETQLGMELNRLVSSGSTIRVPLPPGKTETGTIMLNKEYELRLADTYTVQVERPDPYSGGMLVKSNVITFTIVQ